MEVRIGLLKKDIPKLFQVRGRRRQNLLDEIFQMLDMLHSNHIRITERLDVRNEYLEETNKRLSAEINWKAYLARTEEEVARSRAEWDNVLQLDPENCSEAKTAEE